MAERHMHSQTLANWGSPAQPRHLRRRAGLVDKDQAMGFETHERLAQPDPLIAPVSHVGTILLTCQQRFF
jgi:hypothetical protein